MVHEASPQNDVEIEARVRAELEAHGVVATRLACDPKLADTEDFCRHYGVDPGDSANTIVIASKRPKGVVAACLALADSRLDVNRAVCQALGIKRASFASAELTRDLTGQLIGGVTIAGYNQPLELLVDARVLTRESIIVGGGSRSSKLRLAPAQLQKLPHVRVVEGLATPRG